MYRGAFRKVHKVLAIILALLLVNVLPVETKVSATNGETAEESSVDQNTHEGTVEGSREEMFVKNGGEYSIWYILSKYNLFSFEDVISNHIVGPVIAKETVVHPELKHVSISDLAKGVSSYVGVLNNTFKLEYDYENKIDNFDPPILYSRIGDIVKVEEVTENYEQKLYFTKKDGHRFISPNYSGKVEKTVLDNNYIDFDFAKTKFIEQSKELLEDKENICISEDSTDLVLKVGKKYNITKSENLRSVNFIYDEKYDPYTKPYELDTIINISGTGLGVNGEYNIFPKIFVNGKPFEGDKPSNNEDPIVSINFGEFNNIVWNMPHIGEDGKKLISNVESDILGHIIAPNANFKTNTSGGNINGSAIVKGWEGPKIEMHFYPYKKFNYGEALPATGGEGVDKLLLLGLGMMFIALIALKRNKLY